MPESVIRGLGTINHIVNAKDMGLFFQRIARADEGGKEAMTDHPRHTEPAGQAGPVCGGVMQRTTLGNMFE